MLSFEAKWQIVEFFLLEEQVCSAVDDAKTFPVECNEVRKNAKLLFEMFNTLLRFITSAEAPLYLRPIDSIVAAVNDNFKLALAIVSDCKGQSLSGRFFIGRNAIANQFHRLFNLLDASVSDVEWLVTVYDPRNEAIGPITVRKSAKFLVWSCLATVQMGRILENRLTAVKYLALIAQGNDEYKEIIFEEGGVPPLQELLKDFSCLDAQITVANALCLLAEDARRKEVIMCEMISTIVDGLSRKWSIRYQIQAADLVASIAKHHPEVKEYHLIRENVVWRLATLLSSEQSIDDPRANSQKLKLKISCSNAMLMLARWRISNCRTLTETKVMLCLAEMVETEKGEIQNNCLMILKEITSLAELNKEFRHSAFKSTTSGAAKAVVDQLLRVIKQFDDTTKKNSGNQVGWFFG